MKIYISFYVRQNLHIFRFRCLWFLLNEFKDAARTGNGILKLGNHTGNLIEGLGILVCIAQETSQLSDRHSAAHGCQCSRNSHTRVHKTVYKAGGRVCDRGKEDRPQGIFLKAAIDFIKPGTRLLLMTKCLNYLLVADHLVDQRCLFTSCLGLLPEHIKGMLCNEGSNQPGNRCYQQNHEGDSHIDAEHESNGSKNRNHTGKQLGKSHEQTICKLIYIRNNTAYDLSG